MVNGEIFFARFSFTLDTGINEQIFSNNNTLFPTADFEIIASKFIPVSGGNGKSIGVMVVIARALT